MPMKSPLMSARKAPAMSLVCNTRGGDVNALLIFGRRFARVYALVLRESHSTLFATATSQVQRFPKHIRKRRLCAI